MKWVTRWRPRVNRAATAWIIRRFVDPGAEILFVNPGDVAGIHEREAAIGFDAPGATYPHRDARGRCSFEALAEEHRPDDGALRELGRIVHGADFAGEVHVTPKSAGLHAISHGFLLVTADDYAIVEKASVVYDVLYASLGECHKNAV